MGSCCPVGRVLDTRDACGLVTPDVSTYKHTHVVNKLVLINQFFLFFFELRYVNETNTKWKE